MKTRFTLLVVTLCALLAACEGEKIKIVVSRDEHSPINHSKLMVIDEKDTIKMQDTTFNIYLTTGIHHVQFDTGAPVKIVVQKDGGMINADYQEFVAFEVSYEDILKDDKKTFDMSGARVYPTVAILIDSTIITPVLVSRYAPVIPRTELLAALTSSKNGNVMGLNTITPGYDESEAISRLKKFGKGNLYINKFWDYDLNEELPDTIEVNSKRIYTSTSSRSTILPANTFLVLAMMSPEEYTVSSFTEFLENRKPESEDSTDTEETVVE